MNGKLEGKGKKIFEDNGYYEGEFKEGIYHGKGKIVDKNNETKYEGDFVKGRYEGNGTLIYDNGNSYIGQFHHGKELGKGVLLDKDRKVLYEGEFNEEKGIIFYAKIAINKVKNKFEL